MTKTKKNSKVNKKTLNFRKMHRPRVALSILNLKPVLKYLSKPPMKTGGGWGTLWVSLNYRDFFHPIMLKQE